MWIDTFRDKYVKGRAEKTAKPAHPSIYTLKILLIFFSYWDVEKVIEIYTHYQ